VLNFDSLLYKDPTCGCWIWLGTVAQNGYGRITTARNRDKKPHHLLYEQTYGKWSGMLRHLCHTKLCCNPAHLMPGTAADNSADEVRANKTLKGDRNGHSILTEYQVIAILTRATHSSLDKSLGIEFGVSRCTISDIRLRKTWTHIHFPFEGGNAGSRYCLNRCSAVPFLNSQPLKATQ